MDTLIELRMCRCIVRLQRSMSHIVTPEEGHSQIDPTLTNMNQQLPNWGCQFHLELQIVSTDKHDHAQHWLRHAQAGMLREEIHSCHGRDSNQWDERKQTHTDLKDLNVFLGVLNGMF